MIQRAESFYFGLTLPFRAAKLIFSHPRLLFWSVLPTAITLTLYYYFIAAITSHIAAFILAHVGDNWLLVLISKVLVFVAAALTFSFAANLISTPFNDFLAESTERWAEPALPEPEIPSTGIFAGYWRNKVRLIGIDAVKTFAAMIMGMIALLCSWIPVVNLAAVLITFLVFSFQFISYPQTRRGEKLSRALSFLGRHFFACLGFGAIGSLLFSIPIVSCLAIPLAVVSGTLLVARAREKNGFLRLF
jgi:uncharacterized protein involved in cysteine biosynthesis